MLHTTILEELKKKRKTTREAKYQQRNMTSIMQNDHKGTLNGQGDDKRIQCGPQVSIVSFSAHASIAHRTLTEITIVYYSY